MKEFLSIVGLLLWAAAGFFFLAAPSAMQEMVASVIGVSGSVLIGSAAIIGAVEQAGYRVADRIGAKPAATVEPAE